MTSRDASNRRTTNTRQRKKQQHLLDVKIRTSTERRRRMSAILGFSCKLILITTLAVGAWIGGQEGLRRFLWENPDYFIREVKISTDGALARDQVLRVSGIVEGSNIFLVNLSEAREAIGKLPQVENAEVTRTLPNRIAVTITERRPIAWLVSRADEDPTASDKSFLIDARGMVMKTKVKLEEYLNFPTISGMPTTNLVPGERVSTVEMQAALELIRLTAESTRFQPRHIDVAKGYCLVVTDHNRAKITFGLDRIDAQLTRLNRYFSRAAEDFREIQTVNLLVERNTPVTFYEPQASDAGADDDAASPPARSPDLKANASSTTSRALPVATPAAATPTARAGVLSAFKPKPSSTPAGRKSGESVKKKPFRLH